MSRFWKSLREFSLSPNQTEPTMPNPSPVRHQTQPARLDPADRHNFSVGPAIVPDDHAPDYCEENVPNIKSGEGLGDLVDMQQNLIAALQTEMCDMDKTMVERDKTILEKDKIIKQLKSEIDDSSRHREGQLEQLLWLDNLVNEKDAKIYDRELALDAMNVTMSDQASTIDTLHAELDLLKNLSIKETITTPDLDSFEVQYWRSAHCEQEVKFRALHTHCRSLAIERDRLEDQISALSICKAKTKELFDQQQKLTKSLLALVEKEKKTKFINGSHSLDYTVTEPTPAVREEIADSKSRIRSEDITRLSNLVDTLAHKYSPEINRYSQSNPTDDSEQVCVTNPEHLPLAVPKEMYAIWLHSHEEDLTVEEEEEFNGFHAREMRPPPIYSPNLPKPYVNWMRFNPNMRRNLPIPMMCPKLGCSQDPNFYNLTVPTTNQTPYTRHYTDHPPTPVFEKGEPFGSEYGFVTEMGVMPVPSTPVHGFVFYGGSWVIASGYYGG